MGLFGFLGGGKKKADKSEVIEVAWSKNAAGKFRRLPFLELAKENVSGVSAVYVIWHGGMKPGWVYVGLADDLAMDITDAKQSSEIMEHDMRGGAFITWQTFPKNLAPGVFAFLTDVLQPEVRNPEADMYRNKEHVKVLPPGYTKETFSQLVS
ncbi:conserved hypothetical protein [Candidatus Terasakiella magnetica]|uniref:Uncharacterized protein n=1 Tax=Candidatus Terasakiella magnetica TaxID=1867952 RepID=A0A1C3RGL1_9PROT|nr:hypothetical protein [Candidatus Terasakiella magnetica]SCA56405.1 conserved hypothetical protein [Candidatus Terasakiella magnetica]